LTQVIIQSLQFTHLDYAVFASLAYPSQLMFYGKPISE